MWAEGSARSRSSSYYQGCLPLETPGGGGAAISCSGPCWALADLEAGVWLGEVPCPFLASACVRLMQTLVRGESPCKGTWAGGRV